jgi:hypothetical protein
LRRADRLGGGIFLPPIVDLNTTIRQPELAVQPRFVRDACACRFGAEVGVVPVSDRAPVPSAAGDAPFFVKEEQTCLA